MSTANLLVMPDETNERSLAAFQFDHAMAHRAYFAVMAPLTRFSAIPYFVEPVLAPPPPYAAGMWMLKHQQAHTDFTNSLPPNYMAPKVGFGIQSNQPMVDSDLSDPENRAWFTFVNHQEHYLANNSILPLPTAAPPPSPALPGWYRGTRYPYW
jgi:hypothetical protein